MNPEEMLKVLEEQAAQAKKMAQATQGAATVKDSATKLKQSLAAAKVATKDVKD